MAERNQKFAVHERLLEHCYCMKRVKVDVGVSTGDDKDVRNPIGQLVLGPRGVVDNSASAG